MKLAQFVFVAWLCATTFFVWECSAAVSTFVIAQHSPTILSAPLIDFEGYAEGTVANLLYQDQGITFSRDDGQSITIVNATTSGLVDYGSSGSNLLWTGSSLPTEGSLEIQSSIPLYSIGAFFGATSSPAFSYAIVVTVFDSSGRPLDSVPVYPGFPSTPFMTWTGIQSTTPFSRVRFDSPLGIDTTEAVPFFLDDFRFSSRGIPEPRSLTLVWLGLSLMFVLRQPKVFHLKNRFHRNWRSDGIEIEGKRG